MTGLKIGYARVSTVGQDLTAQRDGLAALGVEAERVYVDHGLTGTTRVRPGLREALAACRTGDTLVALLVDLHRSGQKNPSDLAELFGVGRSTVYRTLQRAGADVPAPPVAAAAVTAAE